MRRGCDYNQTYGRVFSVYDHGVAIKSDLSVQARQPSTVCRYLPLSCATIRLTIPSRLPFSKPDQSIHVSMYKLQICTINRLVMIHPPYQIRTCSLIAREPEEQDTSAKPGTLGTAGTKETQGTLEKEGTAGTRCLAPPQLHG